MAPKKKLAEARRLEPAGDMPGIKYLDLLRGRDQVFKIRFRTTLYAEQNVPSPPKVAIGDGGTIGGTVERSKTLTQGVESQTKVPTTRATEIAETKVTEGQLIQFPMVDGKKVVPAFGGSYGIMDRAMRRVAKAIKHRMYKEQLLGLIAYSVGDNGKDLPIPESAKVTQPPWQQQINVGFGKTARVWQIREIAHDIEGEVVLKISSSAPVQREEVYELLHGLEGRGFGPTDHGDLTIMDITP